MKKLIRLLIICTVILLVQNVKAEAFLINFETINVESVDKFSINTDYGKAHFNASVGNTIEDILVADHTLQDSLNFSGQFWKNTSSSNQMSIDLDFESTALALWFHGTPKDAPNNRRIGLFVNIYDKDGNLLGGRGTSGADNRWDTFSGPLVPSLQGQTFNKVLITFIDPDLNGGSLGNDIGIDDIFLTAAEGSSTVPEPLSLTLLGFGLIGLKFRDKYQ